MRYIFIICTALTGYGTYYFVDLAWHAVQSPDIYEVCTLIIFAVILAAATIASGLWSLTYFMRF